jgi:hypothetical protein
MYVPYSLSESFICDIQISISNCDALYDFLESDERFVGRLNYILESLLHLN